MNIFVTILEKKLYDNTVKKTWMFMSLNVSAEQDNMFVFV